MNTSDLYNKLDLIYLGTQDIHRDGKMVHVSVDKNKLLAEYEKLIKELLQTQREEIVREVEQFLSLNWKVTPYFRKEVEVLLKHLSVEQESEG